MCVVHEFLLPSVVMLENKNRFYVYQYLRESGLPYYVGKGSNKRAWRKGKNEFKPPNDLSRIDIIIEGVTEETAFRIEKQLIQWWGRKDLGTGILSNRTDGGEGSANFSEATRQKLRDNGYKHTISEVGRKRISEAQKSRTNRVPRGALSPEEVSKLRERSVGNTFRKGATHTEEAREKIRKARAKQVHPSSGKVRTEEYKEKMRESMIKQTTFPCSYCSVVAAAGNIKRWHNDNCKNKPNMDKVA